MRTFTPPADTRFYAGVDLHARSLFLVILDADGQTRFARNLRLRRDESAPTVLRLFAAGDVIVKRAVSVCLSELQGSIARPSDVTVGQP